MGLMVVVIVFVIVVVGGKIVMVKVVHEDYLMEVEEEWLMNDHACFGTYHWLGLDRLS